MSRILQVLASALLVIVSPLSAQCAPDQSPNPPPFSIPAKVGGPSHPVTIEEILCLREIRDLALSPDERRVAFAVRQAMPAQNQYASAIFVAWADGRANANWRGTKMGHVPDLAGLSWGRESPYVNYL